MSQVIVTEDNFRSQRNKSKEQEHRIDRESAFAKWRMSDISKKDPIAMAVGYAVMPILAIWYFLGAVGVFALGVVLWVFRSLSRLWPNSSSKKV